MRLITALYVRAAFRRAQSGEPWMAKPDATLRSTFNAVRAERARRPMATADIGSRGFEGCATTGRP